jgi:hypothetical protein
MVTSIRQKWRGVLDHPLVALELRRVRRKRWWPGRRFFLFYPALLGGTLGCGIAVVVSSLLENLRAFGSIASAGSVRLAALVTGVPAVCLLSVVSWLLALALTWIAPALTATTISRETELGTLDLLRSTLLTERSIVLGKLGGCAVRLWPAILTLALLTPFQLTWAVGSGSFGLSPLTMTGIMVDSTVGTGQFWVWLLLAGLTGWLRPWGTLTLNAAVGMLASVVARRSGAAVAIAYGAIIVLRVGMAMVTYFFNLAIVAVPSLLVDLSQAAITADTINSALVLPSLVSLGMLLVEFAVAAGMIWMAIWWLARV